MLIIPHHDLLLSFEKGLNFSGDIFPYVNVEKVDITCMKVFVAVQERTWEPGM
jgi:hypothetical protein